MNEYILWLKDKKKTEVTFKYTGFSDFSEFYNVTRKAGKNTIGLGAVSINQERAREVDFTSPYMKNVAFCITSGYAADVKVRSADEITRALGNMSALTISNTLLQKHVAELKKSYLPDLKITFLLDETSILDEISANVLTFGYVDAVGFWFYLKNNPRKFLKVQKILSQSKETLGFILPIGSRHKALFDEFFSGPGGFKTTPEYRAVLERHLGSYMTQNVAIN
jgi:ABC-type amino acid transport substrate-binding protein